MDLFTHPLPTPTDGHPTPTSIDQASTERSILPLLTRPDKLTRKEHLMWLLKLLFRGFPEGYSSQDASQPWLVYWVLQALIQLGGVMDPDSAKRGVESVMRFTSPKGGFSGGPYQNPHLLPTYAAVCALAIVGGPGEAGGWDQIDRIKLYDFFMGLKQKDGSFVVSEDGEVDMRGCYCLLCVATLLDILTPELVEGLAEYIASCQTYEGGFASACYYLPSGTRARLGEAHGGYTYCALASLFLLRPLVPNVFELIDVPRLVRWATSMQGGAADGGGFRGRTNKLVDGCYSWWVGGMEPLLLELVREGAVRSGRGAEWEDWDDAIFHKEGIQHYTLAIAQVPQGGLRDKPGKPPDAYHTASNLSGLATAQHRVYPSPEVRETMRSRWKVAANPQLEDREGRREAYLASCEWTEDEEADVFLGGEENRVNAIHPLYNLTITSVRKIMGHFYGQEPVKSSVD